MLDIIENPPSKEDSTGQEVQQQDQEKEERKQVESSKILDHKLINSEMFGYLLTWNALFQKLYKGKLKLRLD
jgi:hypothetical protein